MLYILEYLLYYPADSTDALIYLNCFLFALILYKYTKYLKVKNELILLKAKSIIYQEDTFFFNLQLKELQEMHKLKH